MKKFIRNIVIIVYALIAIFVTICLLSYNDYKVSVFGSNSLVIIDNDKLAPDYNSGDLAIVDANKEIEIGDKIFFYNPYEKTFPITLAEVIRKEEITSTETTYTLEGDKLLSSEYVIGSEEDITVIPNVGTVLQVLESQWGFLILIVLPALLAFLYEIIEVVGEIRGKKKNDN